MAKTILIVDDDDDVRKILRFYCQEAGFAVLEATSFDSAMMYLHESGAGENAKIDAVVCDIHMPGRSGLDLAKEVSQSAFRCPVILITGYSQFSREEIADTGAVELLRKPFDFSTLIDKLQDYTS